jgi:hypothetical protein
MNQAVTEDRPGEQLREDLCSLHRALHARSVIYRQPHTPEQALVEALYLELIAPREGAASTQCGPLLPASGRGRSDLSIPLAECEPRHSGRGAVRRR